LAKALPKNNFSVLIFAFDIHHLRFRPVFGPFRARNRKVILLQDLSIARTAARVKPNSQANDWWHICHYGISGLIKTIVI
jgi:hypothetical protein